MKRKKIWVLLAVVALFGALLQGCGNNENASNNGANNGANNGETAGNGNGANGGETVTLKVWGDLPNQAVLEEPFKQINAAFEKKNPTIKLQYDFTQNDQTLNVALQANELPDLFWVQGDKTPKMAEMVKNGFLLDLSSYNMDLSRYAESEVSYSTVDGKLYASLPAFFDTNVIFYNKDLFKDNGIEIPATWDDFVATLDKLKEKGITPIALPGKSEWDRAWPAFTFGAAFATDALKAAQTGSGKLTDPAIAEALQFYRDFADKGYFGKDFLAQDLAAAQFAFTNGKAAMIVDGTWNNPTYEASDLNLGRFPLPNKEGKKIVQGGYSNFMTYAVSSKSEHPDQAVKYLEFLNSQEAQQIMEDATGSVPTLKDITPKNEAVKELSQFDAVGANIYTVLSKLASTESNTPDVLMKEVLPKLMTSEIGGAEAAALLDKAAVYPAP